MTFRLSAVALSTLLQYSFPYVLRVTWLSLPLFSLPSQSRSHNLSLILSNKSASLYNSYWLKIETIRQLQLLGALVWINNADIFWRLGTLLNPTFNVDYRPGAFAWSHPGPLDKQCNYAIKSSTSVKISLSLAKWQHGFRGPVTPSSSPCYWYTLYCQG